MYFPYVRGRQYELLSLRELVANNLISKKIVPVVEPVKLSPTLVNMMAEFIKANHPISIIRNPSVGTFLSDYQKVSTMHPNGLNLAVFDKSKFKCTSVSVYDIKTISYSYDRLK